MHFVLRIVTYRPFRFLIGGGTAAVVNLSLLYALVHSVHVWYLAAAAISYAVAIGVSFFMQKFYTFGDRGREGMGRQSVLFAILQFFNLGINTVFMYIIVSVFGVHYLIAQVTSAALIATYTFVVLKYFMFKSTELA